MTICEKHGSELKVHFDSGKCPLCADQERLSKYETEFQKARQVGYKPRYKYRTRYETMQIDEKIKFGR